MKYLYWGTTRVEVTSPEGEVYKLISTSMGMHEDVASFKETSIKKLGKSPEYQGYTFGLFQFDISMVPDETLRQWGFIREPTS